MAAVGSDSIMKGIGTKEAARQYPSLRLSELYVTFSIHMCSPFVHLSRFAYRNDFPTAILEMTCPLSSCRTKGNFTMNDKAKMA